MGTNLGPNSFDPQFPSKIEFGTPFNPFVFFSCPISGFIPYSSQAGVHVPSFNDFTDNFIAFKFVALDVHK
jgi:hypothetical protein